MQDGDDEIIHSDNDSERQNSDNEVNPLVVPLLDDDGHGPTQEEITNKWFSQDIFAEAVEDGDLGRFDSEDEMQVHSQEMEQTLPETDRVKRETQAHVASNSAQRPTSQKDDFEIVPAPAPDLSDDSSSDESYEDIDTKAEILACANKMLRKKQREQILDDAYNKYMFDDEGLPKWFLDEERRHRQPIKPVTREDIAAMKAQFKEIDARPAKKVAEAKARKKRVAMKKLEKVRKKANMISEQTDVSDRSKRKQIEQLYKKATVPKRSQKEYVVAKKGVLVKVGKGKVLVDRRMKKDLRARGTVKAGKGSSKNGKTARGRRVYKSFRKGRKE